MRNDSSTPRMLFDRMDRYEVCRMLVRASEHSDWLDVDGWDIFQGGFDFQPHLTQVQQTLDQHAEVQCALRQAGFERLTVTYVMGDDHYRKCCSDWTEATIIGRGDITPSEEKDLQLLAEQHRS